MVGVNASFFGGPEEKKRNSVDDSGVVAEEDEKLVEEDEKSGQVEGVEVEELMEEDGDVEESVCRWRCLVKCLLYLLSLWFPGADWVQVGPKGSKCEVCC
jgi:hypothetical protein